MVTRAATPGAGPADVDREHIDAMRAFTRFYTAMIGVLEEGLLDTPYSVTEARVIYELAQQGPVDAAELRRVLRIDSGYMSRIAARFETDGLITRDRSATDARRQVLALTEHGRDIAAVLDARSNQQIAELLAPVPEPVRRRLVASMNAIRTVLEPADPAPTTVVIRPPRSGDYGWVVARHGALYASEYGWDETFEGLVAGIVGVFTAGHDPAREAAWIAEVDGERAGCVFCVTKDDATAQLRLLLVEPSARGLGVGARLVDECIGFARRAGYSSVNLWTNDVLVSARRIYEAAGFTLVDEEPHHSFGQDLVGQNWALGLTDR